MGLVIDTSAYIFLERRQMEALPSIYSEDEVFMPAIVWAELLIGLRMASSPSKARSRSEMLNSYLSGVILVPFTMELAGHYANIYAELSKIGKRIPQNDIAIAATARACGCPVLVGPADEQHYRLVNGLEVVVLPAT